HRSQFVMNWKGRKFYNDSKATNALATKSALEAFSGNIVLLAGGLERNHSIEELRPYMERVKALITFGETSNRFEQFAKDCGVENIEKVPDMMKAVEEAVRHSEDGDNILLSPACASWDQYENFEIRGDAFIDAVRKVTEMED